jgi:hypothetical protein
MALNAMERNSKMILLSCCFVRQNTRAAVLTAVIWLSMISVITIMAFGNARAVTGSGSQADPDTAAVTDIHSFQNDSLFPSEPYFNTRDIAIAWDEQSPPASHKIELALDSRFRDPLALLNVTGAGPYRVPGDILSGPGRYFFRVKNQEKNGFPGNSGNTKWFAYDPRFVGYRTLVTGDHPMGKTEASIHVRDQSSRIHMVISRQNGTTGTSRVLWLSSVDDGSTWINHGPVNLPEQPFAKSASIAIDRESGILYAGYLAAESMRMPNPVIMCRCDLNSEEPRFVDHKQISEHPASGRPCLDVDDSGVVHVCWVGPALPFGFHPPAVYYSNNAGGAWNDEQILSENQTNGAGAGANLVCLGNTVHVVWEGGAWRYSRDHGDTWVPPMSSNPEFIASVPENSHIRFRMGTVTEIPGRDSMAAVLIGERRDGLNSRTWIKNLNMDEIWIVRYHGDSGWNHPERVKSLDDEVAKTAIIQPDQKVHFFERPDVTADGTGRVFVCWDETTGCGPDQKTHQRTAYVTWTDETGGFIIPKPFPAIGNLCSMKPLLGQARPESGFDVTWFAGEMPSPDLRPMRPGMDISVMGMLFATQDTLESPERSKWHHPKIYTVDSEPGLRSFSREELPKVCFPEMSSSAMPPTWTARPTSTPRPTPSPTPAGNVRISLQPVADTYVDEAEPSVNFGTYLQVFAGITENGLRKHGLIRFDVQSVPQDAYVLHAELYLYNLGYPENETLQIWTLGTWDEMTATWDNRPVENNHMFQFNDWKQPVIITGLVQDWVRNPADNYGLGILLSSDTAPGSYWFFSRESNKEARLWITYTCAGLPTKPAGNGLSIDLTISSHVLSPGDLFELDMEAFNDHATLRCTHAYLILDLMGNYWFWPDWTQTPEYEEWDINGHRYRRETVLQFTWPDGAGEGDSARFWAFLQDVNSDEFVWDTTYFSWGD